MNKRISSRFKSAVLLASVLALFPLTKVHADDQVESFTPSLLSSSGQEDISTLNIRLQTAKKDLEVFRTFAEHFRNNGESKTTAQLQGPLDDYIKKHVDNLLAQTLESSTLDTIRSSAEIMFVKTRLHMIMDRGDAAKATVSDMKKRFAPYQKITVQTPGKTTTLDEVIRQLEEELTKTTFTKKN